jgi:hypothetical protein
VRRHLKPMCAASTLRAAAPDVTGAMPAGEPEIGSCWTLDFGEDLVGGFGSDESVGVEPFPRTINRLDTNDTRQ